MNPTPIQAQPLPSSLRILFWHGKRDRVQAKKFESTPGRFSKGNSWCYMESGFLTGLVRRLQCAAGDVEGGLRTT